MQTRSLAIAGLGLAVAGIGSFLVLNFFAAPNEAWLLKGGMTLSSDGFSNGTAIPTEYTCKGTDTSPPFSWAGSPPNTVSYALLMEDPDAPSGMFTHWIVYNIPPSITSLSSGQPSDDTIYGTAVQGKNGFGTIGYRGPCPPGGSTHHYRIMVFALDTSLKIPPGSSRGDLLRNVMGHVVASGTMTGNFG